MPLIVLNKAAEKYFERLDERIKAQLREKLNQLGTDPDSVSGIKPLQGAWKGFYRLRHGDLRIIYTFNRAEDRIVITVIGPRGDIYK